MTCEFYLLCLIRCSVVGLASGVAVPVSVSVGGSVLLTVSITGSMMRRVVRRASELAYGVTIVSSLSVSSLSVGTSILA